MTERNETAQPAPLGQVERGVGRLVPERDTYGRPSHGWTCFHCGETFTTTGSARDHFGAQPDAEPGCQVRVSLGAERGLLMALRKAEDECRRAWAAVHEETTDAHRAMHAMQSRHADALQQAEEAGYERGLRDARRETPNVGIERHARTGER